MHINWLQLLFSATVSSFLKGVDNVRVRKIQTLATFIDEQEELCSKVNFEMAQIDFQDATTREAGS